MAEYYSIVFIYCILLINCTSSQQFESLDITNSAAISTSVKVYVLYPGLHLFSFMPKNGIHRLNGRPICISLGNLHSAFHIGCTNIPPH
jgi:hypothetical protein